MAKDERLSKEERIQHVITTAKALFIHQGYTATSTSQIARESGIVEITLFRYFATKKELFEAVISPLTNFEWFPRTRISPNEETLPKALILSLLHDRVEFAKRERNLVRLVIIESGFQVDLAGEYNPMSKASNQLHELLLEFGLAKETAQIIVNLLIGLILTIVFTDPFDEPAMNVTLQYVEEQITTLLNPASI